MYNNLIENKVYEKLNKDTYIIDKKRYLMSYIQNYDNWSIGTKKLYLFMIARYLLINNSVKYNKMYSQEGFNLKIQIERNEGENILDNNELTNIKDYSYFVIILESIDYTKLSNINEHYAYLLSKGLHPIA